MRKEDACAALLHTLALPVNAALRPSYTCKADACQFLLETVLERQPNDTVIALGDSLSDLPFMAHGDMAVIPTHSQVWQSVKELAQ